MQGHGNQNKGTTKQRNTQHTASPVLRRRRKRAGVLPARVSRGAARRRAQAPRLLRSPARGGGEHACEQAIPRMRKKIKNYLNPLPLASTFALRGIAPEK